MYIIRDGKTLQTQLNYKKTEPNLIRCLIKLY